jgi:nitric-oxide synthase
MFHKEHREHAERMCGVNVPAFDLDERLSQVRDEIEATGCYRHTFDELTFGAQVAWRNNARCIGRLYWRRLRVRDRRGLTRVDEIAHACAEHLREAYNGGRLRPLITVFAPDTPGSPGPRIWNEQLIRYAGHRPPHPGPHGSTSSTSPTGPGPDPSTGPVLGDPRYADFTDHVKAMGWRGPATPGPFDVLPLVIETGREGPRLVELPRDAISEVPLHHPDLDWFADLRLRWHAVPVISNMRLRIGGLDYHAAPFSGWYMGTEIGARNLADNDRYALLDVVARRLGMDTSSNRSLWRDRALVELNRAVLFSFDRAGVTITDHHAESRRFLAHLSKEERAGRECPADWSWIVPPMSAAQTPVFHRYYTQPDDPRPAFLTDADAADRGLRGGPPALAAPSSEYHGS